MHPVTSEQVRDYEGLCVGLARKYVGRSGAEFDDLVQEGRIAVWSSLQDGIAPSSAYVELAMRGWVKTLRRQTS
jgi:DNA-directed RNA polymerase specialized sigma24 family protein